MNVILTCKEFGIVLTAQVSALDYEPATKSFTMPLCMGDDWLQKVRSNLGIEPLDVVFSKGECRIQLETYADMAKFGEWLIDAHKKSQDGYRTMRG